MLLNTLNKTVDPWVLQKHTTVEATLLAVADTINLVPVSGLVRLLTLNLRMGNVAEAQKICDSLLHSYGDVMMGALIPGVLTDLPILRHRTVVWEVRHALK